MRINCKALFVSARVHAVPMASAFLPRMAWDANARPTPTPCAPAGAVLGQTLTRHQGAPGPTLAPERGFSCAAQSISPWPLGVVPEAAGASRVDFSLIVSSWHRYGGPGFVPIAPLTPYDRAAAQPAPPPPYTDDRPRLDGRGFEFFT